MIEISYGHILSKPILPTLYRLNQVASFDPKTAYRLSKILNALEKVGKELAPQVEAIAQKYAKKGEDGELLRTPNGGFIPVPETEAEYMAESQALRAQVVSVQQHKLPISSLNVRVSPEEMEALEVILEGLDEEPGLPHP